uniref:(northern house mosquito) hypothetical protein n=1 Tax=Culex pipiens TaxID=7175 RepID=A0A8D8A1U5_CULPI
MPPKRRVKLPQSDTEKQQREGANAKNVGYLKEKLAQIQSQLKEEEGRAGTSADNSFSDEDAMENGIPTDDELVRPPSPARSDGLEGQDLDENGEESSQERSVLMDDLEEVNSAQDINSEERSFADESSSSRDIFEDSPRAAIPPSNQLNKDAPEPEGERIEEVVPKAEYDKLFQKLSKKRVEYLNLRKRFQKLEIQYAELKEVCSDQAKENYKLRNDGEEVELFAAEDGIQLTSVQIKDISLASKNPFVFAQNLAVAIFGPQTLRQMSVTGRAWTQSSDKIAKPKIPENVLNFIYSKVLERVMFEKGPNKSAVLASAKPAQINRALAEKISNLRKAHRLRLANERAAGAPYLPPAQSSDDEEPGPALPGKLPKASAGRSEKKSDTQSGATGIKEKPSQNQPDDQFVAPAGLGKTARTDSMLHRKSLAQTQPVSARLVPTKNRSMLETMSSGQLSQPVGRSFDTKEVSQKSELGKVDENRKSSSHIQPQRLQPEIANRSLHSRVENNRAPQKKISDPQKISDSQKKISDSQKKIIYSQKISDSQKKIIYSQKKIICSQK